MIHCCVLGLYGADKIVTVRRNEKEALQNNELVLSLFSGSPTFQASRVRSIFLKNGPIVQVGRHEHDQPSRSPLKPRVTTKVTGTILYVFVSLDAALKDHDTPSSVGVDSNFVTSHRNLCVQIETKSSQDDCDGCTVLVLVLNYCDR